jgi:putative membrane protein
VTEYSRTQAYFGRFGIFACIGLAQSTLAVLGLIFFVQIEAAHPLLLMLCGWVTSLVFMLIVYTLVLSFGSAGKAISVLLLVFQVSGAGGAYPWSCCPSGSRTSARGCPPPTRSTRCVPPSPVSTGVTCGSNWACCCCSRCRCSSSGSSCAELLDGYNRKTTEAIESTRIMQ